MAKISALSALTTPTADDLLVLVDNPLGTPASKKITFANFEAALRIPSANVTGGQVFDVTKSVSGLAGADPTGATDSTAAILRTISAATSTGGILYFPPGTYLVSGAGTELFLITVPLLIRGAGFWNTRIKVAASVGATTDIFRIAPTAAPANKGFEFADIGFDVVSGTPGRHCINLDASSVPVYHVTIQRCYFGETGGWAIATTNTPPNQDGIFLVQISNNLILKFTSAGGGILLQEAGDSIRLVGNTIYSEDYGIDGQFVVGAAAFLMDGNNITATKGVILRSGLTPMITNNNIELVAGDTGSVNGAALDLAGTSGTRIQSPFVRFNQFNVRPTAPIDACRFGYVDDGIFSGNAVYVNTPKYGLRVTANAVGTEVGKIQVGPGSTGAAYLNEGDATLVDIGNTGTAWVAYTPSLSSAAGTLTSASAAGYSRKVGKTVWFRATATIITNGTGATAIKMGLPVAAKDAYHSFSGREGGVTGKSINASLYPDTSTLYITFYDGTYPGGNSYALLMVGVYEAA